MSLEQGISNVKKAVDTMPTSSGVYRMLDSKDNILYIGKARNLKNRVVSYSRPKDLSYRLKAMISQIEKVEITVTNSEAEALLLEALLIKREQPPYNILLKDGKSFPYIFLSDNHDFNQMKKHRGARKEKGDYFGPFTSASAVNYSLDVLQKAFPLRTCSDSELKRRTRPCLEYQIKRCSAPCVEKVDKKAYKKIVADARKFLRGDTASVKSALEKEMQQASDNMEYEKAATLRNRIWALSKIATKNSINLTTLKNTDVIVLATEGGKAAIQMFFYRRGASFGGRIFYPRIDAEDSKAKILEAFIIQLYYSGIEVPKEIVVNHPLEEPELLQEALQIHCKHKVEFIYPFKGEKLKAVDLAYKNAVSNLNIKLSENKNQKALLKKVQKLLAIKNEIKRIEIYDNSHNQGSDKIGAMVVCTENGFEKGEYRKFNIKSTDVGDDYAMMREVLTRRLKHIGDKGNMSKKPDLIIIDGGKGQLSSVKQVFDELNIDDIHLLAISKGEERDKGKEEYHQVERPSFKIEKTDEAYFFQRIRDEAHRFAITGHRAKKVKKVVTSQLDDIAGIGPTRKKALLRHFGSVREVKNASIDEIKKVDNISIEIAKIIYDYFH